MSLREQLGFDWLDVGIGDNKFYSLTLNIEIVHPLMFVEV